jgi:hypothetical protein
MYVIVTLPDIKVYGRFETEEGAIAFAKEELVGVTWRVREINIPF